MRVMEEHLGRQSPLLTQPHSEQFLAWIRQVCRDNWKVSEALLALSDINIININQQLFRILWTLTLTPPTVATWSTTQSR